MTATDRVLLDQLVQATKSEIAPTMADDEFFEFFCSQSLLLNERLAEDEIKFGLIGGDDKAEGGSTDGGIDAIYVLVNGRLVRSPEDAEKERSSYKQSVEINVVLIQASREEGFKLQRLLRIKQAIENIFSLDKRTFSEMYNPALLEAIETFRTLHKVFATKHVSVNIEYFYMNRGDVDSISPDVQGLKMEIENGAGKILATIKKCKVNFIGARGVFDLASREPVATYPLPCSVSLCQQDGRAHVALVKLKDYFRFIRDEKDQLRTNFFDTNVRDYQGDADVNKAIGETLLMGQEEFWWLNNGITVVTPKIGGHARELVVDDPQIVNGLQTSQKIFDYFISNVGRLQTDTRELLIRVIQVNDSKTQDDIIEATNSQTKVAPSSFWATKTIHRDIETVFANESLFYDRRKSSYRRKGIALDKVVGITELAQIVASVLLQEPDHARARPARYFKDKKQHDRVFSDKYDIGLYTKCAEFGKTVGSFVHDNERDKGVRRNIVFYVMMVAACLATRTLRPRPQRIAGLDSKAKVTDALLREAMQMVKTSYKKHGASDRAAKGTEMLADLKKQVRDKFNR
jgi:AIPR protein